MTTTHLTPQPGIGHGTPGTSPLICLIGPTASGKSALALALAQHLKGEILAVDSMTVYKHMDIGTAKPTQADRALVPHHGLDLVEPTEEFTVSRFVQNADNVIADCRARNVPLIAVGGTPLYFVSLTKGLFEGPEGNEDLRNKLRQESNAHLHFQLKKVDPESAERIHPNDQKRLVRALEVYQLTGKPISSLQTEWESGQARHPALWLGMSWDREELNKRINARAKQMIEQGWLEEVKSLPKPLSQTAGEAAGYSILGDHLRGLLTLDEALEEIKQSTRQLARKQLKWFRRFENVTWIAGQEPLDQQVQKALEALTPKMG